MLKALRNADRRTPPSPVTKAQLLLKHNYYLITTRIKNECEIFCKYKNQKIHVLKCDSHVGNLFLNLNLADFPNCSLAANSVSAGALVE